ncbi:MAG: hypothetical protein U0V74_01585 [Chitinophagales bacterium]
MENITYLFGAGASAQSMPVVKDFNFRLKEFKQYLQIFARRTEQDFEMVPLIRCLTRFIEEEKRHFSIDTYARKIFIKHGGKFSNDYNELKAVLICYFLFEQMRKEGTYAYEQRDYDLPKKEAINNSLDKRYDALYAGIVTNEGNLPQQFKILSWNYDIQVELSYMGFHGKGFVDIASGLEVLYHNKQKIKQPFVVKLNGTCWTKEVVEIFKDTAYYSHCNELFVIKSAPFDFFTMIFDRVLLANLFNILNFAWETDYKKDTRILEAKRIMGNTDILVITGYSFPNYNMHVDREIFSAASRVRKIFIQEINLERHEIVRSRLNYLDSKLYKKVQPFTPDIDLFLIPSEFYGDNVLPRPKPGKRS